MIDLNNEALNELSGQYHTALRAYSKALDAEIDKLAIELNRLDETDENEWSDQETEYYDLVLSQYCSLRAEASCLYY